MAMFLLDAFVNGQPTDFESVARLTNIQPRALPPRPASANQFATTPPTASAHQPDLRPSVTGADNGHSDAREGGRRRTRTSRSFSPHRYSPQRDRRHHSQERGRSRERGRHRSRSRSRDRGDRRTSPEFRRRRSPDRSRSLSSRAPFHSSRALKPRTNNQLMGQPSEAARDFLSGKALSARLANTPPFIALDTRTVQQLAAGRTVCMHEVYKAQAKAAADAQEHRGNSTSSRVLTMLPHHDSTTTPVTRRNILEVFKAFYPGAAADLDWYAQFMERFLGRASTRAFFIMDHAMRKQYIEEGIPFSPLQPDIVLDMTFLLQAYPRPVHDFDAIFCSNCGGYHRKEECPKFALVFTPTPTPTAPARHKRDHDPSASRSRSRHRLSASRHLVADPAAAPAPTSTSPRPPSRSRLPIPN